MTDRDLVRDALAAHYPNLPVARKTHGWIVYCRCGDAFGSNISVEDVLSKAIDHSTEIIKKAFKVEAASRG